MFYGTVQQLRIQSSMNALCMVAIDYLRFVMTANLPRVNYEPEAITCFVKYFLSIKMFTNN